MINAVVVVNTHKVYSDNRIGGIHGSVIQENEGSARKGGGGGGRVLGGSR